MSAAAGSSIVLRSLTAMSDWGLRIDGADGRRGRGNLNKPREEKKMAGQSRLFMEIELGAQGSKSN